MRLQRELGDRAGLALSLNTLADVVLDEGEFGDARPLLDESLEINRDLGDQTAIAYLIEDYAGLAAAEARPQKALQLAGFASALRESLPEHTATAEWEIGRSLKLEQAIELALATD